MRLLALTHLSTRYAGHELRDEAREVLPGTEVPRDFDSIEIPFPERGAPELVRFTRSAGPAGADVLAGPTAGPEQEAPA